METPSSRSVSLYPKYVSDDHRSEVTELVLSSALKGGRLLVLGAGAATDLELDSILTFFAEVDFVDRDLRVMEENILPALPRFGACARLHALDITGMAERLSFVDADSAASVAQLCRDAERFRLPLPQSGYDVVLSAGVLSQLNVEPIQRLGDSHPLLVPLLKSIRRGHIEQITTMLRSEGVGIIVADVVSSATMPEIWTCPTEDSLRERLVEALNDGNFFHGMNPFAIHSAVESVADVRRASIVGPWRWIMGDLAYATTAIRFERTQSPDVAATVDVPWVW